MRETAGHRRPVGVRDLRRRRPGRARRRPADLRRAVRRRRSARSSTPRCSTPRAASVSDLTVMRLGARPLPGGHRRRARHGRQEVVRRPAARDDGAATVTDLTSAYTTIGIWGPRARDILASLTGDDVSHEGFGFGTCRRDRGRASLIGAGLPDLLRRRARLGALRPDGAGRAGCGTLLLEAGAPHGAVPVGIGVYGTTGPDREGLPGLRRRARRASAPSSRPACSGPR